MGYGHIGRRSLNDTLLKTVGSCRKLKPRMRAGSARRRFAVVADEVRNLAGKSAEEEKIKPS
jgi:hypothetical protein